MLTITEDPARVIPNIMESDVDNKVILIHLTGQFDNNYIGLVKRTDVDQLRITGGHVGNSGVSWWNPLGTSLINLLCYAWETYIFDYYIRIFVINNIEELNEVIATYGIKNQIIHYESKDVLTRSNHR